MGVFVRGRKLWITYKAPDGRWRNVPSGLYVGDEDKAREMFERLNSTARAARAMASAVETTWSARWRRPRPLHEQPVAHADHRGPVFICEEGEAPRLLDQIGVDGACRTLRSTTGAVRSVSVDVPAYVAPAGLDVPDLQFQEHWIYLIATSPEMTLERVKIGYEKHLASRLVTFRTVTPMATLLRAWPVRGIHDEEKAIDAVSSFGSCVGGHRRRSGRVRRVKGAEVFDIDLDLLPHLIDSVTSVLARGGE